MYAFISLLVLNFIEDGLRLISRSFYKEWDDYLEIAELFGLIWMIGMLIVTSKQRKALEKERRINEEKEREYRLSEKLKAELEIQVKERTAELTKQKARLQNYDKLLNEDQKELDEKLEIYIPNGPSLGTNVIEAKNVAKAFGDKLLYDNIKEARERGVVVTSVWVSVIEFWV